MPIGKLPPRPMRAPHIPRTHRYKALTPSRLNVPFRISIDQQVSLSSCASPTFETFNLV